MNTLIELLPYIGGAYETLARVIPTKKNWSIVHGVLKGLLFLSTLLNKDKTSTVAKAVLIVFTMSLFASCKTIAHIDCISRKPINVTLIDSKGNSYTTQLSYCDSILLRNLPDSNKIRAINVKQ